MSNPNGLLTVALPAQKLGGGKCLILGE